MGLRRPGRVRRFLRAAARRSGTLRRIADLGGGRRARRLVDPWVEELEPGSTLLDVGCGLGHVADYLRRRGHRVVVLDLTDNRMVELPLVCARAEALPFAAGSFDYVLFCTMLHHVDAASHHAILARARAVATRGVILVEDVFEGRAGRRVTQMMDRLLNLDAGRHPHANRRVEDWLAVLADCGLRPLAVARWRAWWGPLPLRHAALVGRTEPRQGSAADPTMAGGRV